MNGEISAGDEAAVNTNQAGLLRRVSRGCAWGAMGLGVLGIASWILGSPASTRFGPDYFSTSPSSAVCVLLLGVAMHGALRPSVSHRRLLCLGVLMPVFGLAGLSLSGIPLVAQPALTERLHLSADGPPLPLLWQMSPGSAACFLLLAIGIWMLADDRSPVEGMLAALFGSGVGLVSFVIALGYCYGTPLFNAGLARPISLITAVSSLVLGLALVTAAGPRHFPMSVVVGHSIRARLVRVFVPAVFLAVLVNDLLSRHVPGLALNAALEDAIHALVSLVILSALVSSLARRVGSTLDDAEANRRKAEEAHRESERRATALLNATTHPMLLVDLEGRALAANSALGQRLGRKPEELLGVDILQSLMPELAESWRAHVHEVIRTGKPVRFEDEWGGIQMDNSICPVLDAQGKVAALTVFSMDITARKQAEEKLRARESLLRAAFENAPFEFWVRDRDQVCIIENAAVVTHWGSPLGKRPEDTALSPEALAIWQANNRRAFAGEVVRGEIELNERGGPRWMYNMIAPFRVDGEIQGIVGFNIDITERKRVEESLRAAHAALGDRVRERTAALEQSNQELRLSEERFRILFEAAPIAIALHAPDGQFLQTNAAYHALTGYTREELRQMKVERLVHPEDHAKTPRALQQECQGGRTSHRQEIRYLSKGGRVRWADTTTTAICRPDGQLLCLLVLGEDVTDRRRVAQSNRALARLGHQLSAASTPVEAGRIILDVAAELLGWDAAFLHLVSPRGELDPVITFDDYEGRRAEVPPTGLGSSKPTPLMLEVIRSGGRLVESSGEVQPSPPPVAFGNTGRRSACKLYVPIRHGGQALGVLSIQSYTPRTYTEESLRLLQSLADHCAGALERIRSAAALQEEERNHRALLNAIPDALLRLRADGTVLDAQAGDIALLDRPAEAAGHNLSDLIDPRVAEQILHHSRQCLETRTLAVFSTALDRVGTEPATVEIRVVPSGAGEIVVMLRDITAARKTEQAVVEAVAREQRRIGQDLHDDLGQELASIAVKTKILEETLQAAAAPGVFQAAELVRLVNGTIRQTRQLARGLEPVEVELGNLVLALERFAEESEATYRVRCAFECSLPSLQLPPTTGIHLYRMVQEAVRNATQHGKARSLLIQLSLHGLNLVLTVRDDGRGFNPAAGSQHDLGLHIMRYRANVIGASLTIESQPGHGTEVRCVVGEFRPGPCP